ncbi:MAG: ABC transporter substrate-binding protein [Thermoleophilia bacterium]|jgi:branched-chain amino acid transport system substrate-binding protein
MKRRWTLLAVCLILVLALGLSTMACGTEEPATSTEPGTAGTTTAGEAGSTEGSGDVKTLKIGALVALTGNFSASEKLIWEGEQIFEKWINDKGGITIDGQKYNIDMVAQDGQSTAEGSATAATKLIEDDGVKFMVGPVVPFTIIASGNVTEPAGVLRVVLYNCHTPEEYGPNTPLTFIANDVTTDFIQPDCDYLKANYPNAKNIAVLTPDDGAPPIFMPIVKKIMEDSGFTLKGYVEYDMAASDFTPYVTQALAMKPDAMFFVNGWPIFMGNMLKIARQNGFTGPIFGSHEDPYDIAAIAGPAASTEFYTHNIQLDSPKMTPIIKEINAMATEMYGKPSATYVWSFNACYCLTQAIEAAQSLDPKVVAQKWESMPSIDTVYGPGVMGGLESYGIKHNVSYATPFSKLANGKVEFIDFLPVTLP